MINKRTLYHKLLFAVLLGAIALFVVFAYRASEPYQYVFEKQEEKTHLFSVQAIDTMKYSRDRAREMLDDPSYDSFIEKQVTLVAEAGATHIAIGTPYDEEFIPTLKRWVSAARDHNLSVWFRGNFSGWEEWFEYEKIDREQHKALLTSFISANSDIFLDGDIFSPCPECENGGDGDPRQTGDHDGFNDFLVDERDIALNEFNELGKNITIYSSMNGDIAREVITSKTARALGGVVLIDHYVDTPDRFSNDIENISKILNAQIGLGEFGGPIPDINGEMNVNDQADFVRSFLDVLYGKNEDIPVVNYWVLQDGSTALLDDQSNPKPVYYVLKEYFTAPAVSGMVYNTIGEALDEVTVSVASSTYKTMTDFGYYKVFLPSSYETIIIHKNGYKDVILSLPSITTSSTEQITYLEPIRESVWYKVKRLYHGLFNK